MSFTNTNGEEDFHYEDNKTIHKILDDDNLSLLSYSSYDSIDNMKLKDMGQYTCDECCSIPKIINLDEKSKIITLKCKYHGVKNLNLNTYLFNCLNYNSTNWKCSTCQKIQKYFPENFKYCECNTVFCETCFEMHQRKEEHKFAINSSQFDLKCKKSKEHFDEFYIGFCYDCQIQFCSKCKEEHEWHEFMNINEKQVKKEDIKKIQELNKEYERLISYYESLIKLNNLIIYSYNNFKNNYYNLRNINTIINNVRRNEIIESLDNIENKLIFPVEKYSNIYNYIKNLYDFDIKEDTERISINNKFFNNYDLKVLAKLPLNNLRILILENNSISQISCLKNCNFNNLLILNLNNNGIEDISVIESVKFNDIQALFLRYNAIKDILVFGKKKLPSLRQLDLRNNYIKDIKVFDSWKNNLESLQSLYITNNDYDKSKCKETLRILKELIEKEY